MLQLRPGLLTSLPVLALLLSALAQAAPSTQTIKVAGLAQGAEILVDQWGVPHIYAQSKDDAFFAQGFNAARDRLFQIDLWRRRGLGQLSAVFGPAFVAQDRATRLFLFRGDMQKEWQSYGQGAERVSERFVAGINAYVDYVSQNPAALPFEFRQAGYAPARWKTDDVVRIRSHGLTRNLTQEVTRAGVVCAASLEADLVRSTPQPPWTSTVPVGLDPCLPSGLLDVFKLATDNVFFGNDPSISQQDAADAPVRLAGADLEAARLEGSNNWVLSASKSRTGRPILANDPHRAYSAPSLRYIAHLSAPGMDVIGAGEPALPGISIGHNGTIAFGLTIFSIDQEDLYVYELNPANPGQYKYKGQWEAFRVMKDSIAVKGAAAVPVEMVFSRHGPVIFMEPAKQRAFAVRSGWLEPGMAPYFGSVDYMLAKNFTQFKQSMKGWGAPTVNQVYADVAGNIGWVVGGLTPVRPNWDGLLPVPGDGRYEWAGFLSGDKLPSSVNPQQGWLASANEMNFPAGYPYKQYKLGFEWPNDARRVRIGEVLDSKPKLSIEDSMRLQNDLVSIPARRMLALLKPLSTSEPKAAAALALLRGWNASENAQSAQAALFEIWWSRHLNRAYARAVLDPASVAAINSVDPTPMMAALEKPGARFGRQGRLKRDQLLLSSLATAWVDMERLGGPDPAAWQWGKLHYSYYAHPMSTMGDGSLRSKLNVGPFPAQGGANTVSQSSYRPADFLKINGPSFRVVVDVGNWDNSRAINTPGQSGDPDNPHYRDLAASWAAGSYFPLLYSRKAVESATESIIRLQPQ
ncbi:penicillin acylase family protein [Massilia sp. PWRC2]|uniref:penicillin acylase family protein n=1 Tax=Massilia sp. PWRC2 TaxID=2804626 RepID=UPI003CED305F